VCGAALRPAEQIICRPHVKARQDRGHDADHALAALVHPPRVTNAERDNYAQELEHSLLSRGLDATVRAIGKNHDTLRISWAAMSRPVVYNMMTSEGMVQQVPQLGFTKVILTDDGSFSGENTETWRYRWNGSSWIR